MSTSESSVVAVNAAPESAPPPGVVPSQRVMSLDALRGFDMFWILGGDALFVALSAATAGRPYHRPFEVMAFQLDHSAWAGFRFYDLIFPMFVFMVGASLVFSLGKLIATRGRLVALRRVVLRSAVLYFFGIIYYGGFSKGYLGAHDIRLMGVLQRIALAYFFSGILFCFLRPKPLVIVAASLLIAYWGVMSFVRAPGEPRVSFSEGHNLANWLDAHYLPGRKWDGDHDPEGLLSTIPAIATCLLGVFAGLLLRDGKQRPSQKALWLIGAGVISVALGLLWGLQFPIIKKLWTSSFVLVAGGYSSILLGVFYVVIDVWKVRFWAYPFVWIGMNAITLYMIHELFSFENLADRFFGGQLGRDLFKNYAPVASAALAVLFVLMLARFLYKRKIFLRV